MTPASSYSHDATLNAVRLIQLAHDQWTDGLKALQGVRITEEFRDPALRQYGYALTVLLLARGVDDMCKAHVAYRAARPSAADLLDAARYAANRAVHQLANLSQPVGGITFPLTVPFALDRLARFQWLPEAHLPRPEEERDGTQRSLRARYVELLAGHDMSDALGKLRRWFEGQLATLDV